MYGRRGSGNSATGGPVSSNNAVAKDYKALLNYLLREKLYHHAAEEAAAQISRRGNDSYLMLWHAYAIGMEGSIPEAIRELESLRSKRDVQYAAVIALIFFHRRSRVVDRDAVETLNAALSVAEDVAAESAILEGARLRWLAEGDVAEARRLLRGLRLPQEGDGDAQTPFQSAALTLWGWVDCSASEGAQDEGEAAALRQHSMTWLDRAATPRDIDTAMAKARCYAGGGPKNLGTALDQLNTAIALQPSFWPALVERGLLLAGAGEWERAKDSASRVLSSEPQNLPGLRLLALCALVQGGDAVSAVKAAVTAVRQSEPRNAALHCAVAKPFARLCGRQAAVLQQTTALVDAATRLEGTSEYYEELGYENRLLGMYGRAMEAYQMAARLSANSVNAILGQIYCQIQEGALDDAAQQLEFLSVVQDTLGPGAETALLRALLAARQRSATHPPDTPPVALLDACLRRHDAAALSAATDPYAALCAFNPDLRVEIAREYLSAAGGGSGSGSGGGGGAAAARAATETPAGKGLRVLEGVEKAVPGLLEARLLACAARLALGDAAAAARGVAAALAARPDSSAAHLMAAQMALARDDYRSVENSLEQALSCDFKVRSSPLYLLLRAQVQSHAGSLEEARSTLEDALRLPGVRDGGLSSSELTNQDRASIFLEAIDVVSKLGDSAAVQDLTAEAHALFSGTPEEVRVVISSSEQAVRRGDFNKAMAALNSVPRESPSFSAAQAVKARICLSHRRDRKAYAQCYREVADADPCAWSYIQLGEALMRIQAPEAAIGAFEAALNLEPGDAVVAGRLGRALVAMHDYRRAIEHLREALRGAPRGSSTAAPLRLDLGRLCMKLRRFEDAVAVLDQALSEGSSGGAVDAAVMSMDVEVLTLLSQVHEGAGDREQAIKALRRARDVQRAVLDRARSDGGGEESRQRAKLAGLSRAAAGLHESPPVDADRAIAEYKEALAADPSDRGSLLGLARIHLARSDLDACQQHTETVLRLDEHCLDAALLLADVQFLRSEFEAATHRYQALLASHPNSYTALAKLIGLLRRAGRLEEAEKFLGMAEKGDPRSAAHPGLQFCWGLYHMYGNEVEQAVCKFNLARRDGVWGAPALQHMVELYVNPDGDNLWDVAASGEVTGGDKENVSVAEALLQELSSINGSSNGQQEDLVVRVLEGYVGMASKRRERVDAAAQLFAQILEHEKDHVPSLLGLSIAFMLQDQANKARNTLKRIAKMPYTSDLAEEFESSYLLLSELYVERGKFDLAQDLCRRCLQCNKSCSKAWEGMGLIMEKEGSYADAAECYEKSWALGRRTSATVGFKLGFNYLKANRAVAAMDVCARVLAQYPGYPKMREEIMDKAQALIRP